MNPEKGPLQGVRILDIGTMLAAPLAAGMMADQGAEVIKVEPPGFGDVMRYVGATRGGLSSLWQATNRGKRSLALDLKQANATAILHQLVREADILLHNFRPGVAERLKADYATLSNINPDLIYLSVTGFGETGPYSHKAAFDNVIQAFSGVAWSQAHPDSGEPVQYYQLFSDKLTALYAAQALSAALFARERGHGAQHIQLSMLEATINFMWPDVSGTASIIGDDVAPGASVAKGVPLVRFADGYGQIAPVTDEQFHGWCRAFEVDSGDPRVKTVIDRMSHPELVTDIANAIAARCLDVSLEEGIARLEAEDVPCAPAMSLEDLPQHPQLQALNTFCEREHPLMGPIREPRQAARFQKTPAGLGQHCATLGQHSDDILLEAGFSDLQIQQWRKEGLIA